jgi:hypothetical protein
VAPKPGESVHAGLGTPDRLSSFASSSIAYILRSHAPAIPEARPYATSCLQAFSLRSCPATYRRPVGLGAGAGDGAGAVLRGAQGGPDVGGGHAAARRAAGAGRTGRWCCPSPRTCAGPTWWRHRPVLPGEQGGDAEAHPGGRCRCGRPRLPSGSCGSTWCGMCAASSSTSLQAAGQWWVTAGYQLCPLHLVRATPVHAPPWP